MNIRVYASHSFPDDRKQKRQLNETKRQREKEKWGVGSLI